MHKMKVYAKAHFTHQCNDYVNTRVGIGFT